VTDATGQRRIGGWWRLWIALSVLWGIVPVAILVNAWSEMTTPSKNADGAAYRPPQGGDSALRFLDKYATQPQGHALSDSLRTRPTQGAESNPFGWAKPSPAEHAKEVRLRFKAIGIGLAVWLTPPILALGLVFVALWVYRGFQARGWEAEP
jgi:hypothetical protein